MEGEGSDVGGSSSEEESALHGTVVRRMVAGQDAGRLVFGKGLIRLVERFFEQHSQFLVWETQKPEDML